MNPIYYTMLNVCALLNIIVVITCIRHVSRYEDGRKSVIKFWFRYYHSSSSYYIYIYIYIFIYIYIYVYIIYIYNISIMLSNKIISNVQTFY